MPPQRQDATARTPDVAEQELNDRRRADHLRSRRMLGPPQGVGDRTRPLAAGVPAEQLRHLDHVLGTAAADPGHGLGGVARVMALEDLQDAHGILERRIGARQAPRSIRPGFARVSPGTWNQVVAAGRGVETREQAIVIVASVLVGDEHRRVGV